MADEAFEQIKGIFRGFEAELSLPRGFLDKLLLEDDWSFVIKAHALDGGRRIAPPCSDRRSAVCSQLRPDVFDTTSNQKEPEMLADLQARIGRHALQGPISMPNPIPNIDLLIADERSSTIVIAELKWIRKTARTTEIPQHDQEVLKGFTQLSEIREYLRNHPAHLRDSGRLRRLLPEYEHIHYIVVARDYWLWIDPMDDTAIIEYDAFANGLSRSSCLQAVMEELLRYDWLPVEGRDFIVRQRTATCNGMSIESEIFYEVERLGSPPMA